MAHFIEKSIGFIYDNVELLLKAFSSGKHVRIKSGDGEGQILLDSNRIFMEKVQETEHVKDWDMCVIVIEKEPPEPDEWKFFNYGGTTLSQQLFDEKSCAKVVLGSTFPCGISQSNGTIAYEVALLPGHKYKISASVQGFNLTGGNFKMFLGDTELCSVGYSNDAWITLEGRGIAPASNTEVKVVVDQGTQNTFFYIDYLSVREIEDANLMASGIITGNNFTPNFVPALCGLHGDAVASNFAYNGNNQLTQMIWSGGGSPDNVTQTIDYYPGTDKIQYVTTSGSGRTVRETLSWDGDTLTRYEIDCNYIP